jgi:hypothetical protein
MDVLSYFGAYPWSTMWDTNRFSASLPVVGAWLRTSVLIFVTLFQSYDAIVALIVWRFTELSLWTPLEVCLQSSHSLREFH